LLPADVEGDLAFYNFSSGDWLRFLTYSIVCNLLPFLFVHYSLRAFAPLSVSASLVVSPLVGIALAGLTSEAKVSPWFILFAIGSIALTWLVARLNMSKRVLVQKETICLDNGN